METIAFVLAIYKVIDFARIIPAFNTIMLALIESTGLASIFLGVLLVANIAMVPLAQAIWSNHLVGYNSFSNCLNSVFMLAYSKGDL